MKLPWLWVWEMVLRLGFMYKSYSTISRLKSCYSATCHLSLEIAIPTYIVLMVNRRVYVALLTGTIASSITTAIMLQKFTPRSLAMRNEYSIYLSSLFLGGKWIVSPQIVAWVARLTRLTNTQKFELAVQIDIVDMGPTNQFALYICMSKLTGRVGRGFFRKACWLIIDLMGPQVSLE